MWIRSWTSYLLSLFLEAAGDSDSNRHIETAYGVAAYSAVAVVGTIRQDLKQEGSSR